MENDQEKYWSKLEYYFQEAFHLEPEIHNMLFMIGVQELGYGFQQLDKDTKTKVINFASMFILKYIDENDRKLIEETVERKALGERETEEEVYKLAIINYFREKEII